MMVLKKEIKLNLRALLIWTAALLLLNLYIIVIYGSFADQMDEFTELIETMPPALLKAFNMDRLALTDIIQYYGTEGYILLTLFGSMFAVMLGTTLLAKEENEKTIEFLLSKPITRNQVITAKIATYLIYIVLLNLVVAAATVVAVEQVRTEEIDYGILGLLLVGPLLIQLTFANLGFLASVFVRGRRPVYATGIGVVLGMYFLSVISNLTESAEFLRYITPFQWADSADMIINGRIDGLYIALFVLVNVGAVISAYMAYNRKNIAI